MIYKLSKIASSTSIHPFRLFFILRRGFVVFNLASSISKLWLSFVLLGNKKKNTNETTKPSSNLVLARSSAFHLKTVKFHENHYKTIFNGICLICLLRLFISLAPTLCKWNLWLFLINIYRYFINIGNLFLQKWSLF